MKTIDFEPIVGSQERPWFILIQLDIDRKAAANWFDCEPHVAWVDGPVA